MTAAASRKKLVSLVESFQGIPVLVAGDLILDHYIWGRVERISPEAPVVVVQVTEENKRPGGAGNVANNIRSLGASAAVCGVVGDDAAGREMLSIFSEQQIDATGVIIDPSRPTTVKTRVIAHAQQVVRVDREVAKPLPAKIEAELSNCVADKIRTTRAAVISDYAKGAVTARLMAAVSAHREKADGYAVLIDPKKPNFELYRGATVIKPNRREAEIASGIVIDSPKHAVDAGRKLLSIWSSENVLITLGEDGMALVSGLAEKDAFHIPTRAREVYDVSGAGDTVSAVFTLALAAGATMLEASELANYAAGVVVAEVGTVAVTQDQLLDAITGD